MNTFNHNAMTLSELLNAPEGEHFEFKEARNSFEFDELAKYACALANCGGGKVVLGVTDKRPRRVIGSAAFQQPERTRNGLIEILHLCVSFELHEQDGLRVLIFEIANRPTGLPVQFDGVAWWRSGDSIIPMPPEVLRAVYAETGHDFSGVVCPKALLVIDSPGGLPTGITLENILDRQSPRNRRIAEILSRCGLVERSGQGMNLIYELSVKEAKALPDFSGTDANLVRLVLKGIVLDKNMPSLLNRIGNERLNAFCNLLDAYEQLIAFIEKHTLDRFFLIDGQSVSVRSKIAREIVSNTLIHREYTSAFPAKLLVERDKITTENWNLPRTPGRINPNSFTPYPKNPLLANFFVNIGRADALGSGVRSLCKFTKIYSGGLPELIEDDIFRCVVPLTLKVAKVADKVADNLTSAERTFLRALESHFSDNEWFSNSDAQAVAEKGIGSTKRFLRNLSQKKMLEAQGQKKTRKYRLISLPNRIQPF